jgi:hypothetical protein
MASPGGVIIVDDYQVYAVRRAVRYGLDLACTIEETSIDDPRHHWVVLRTASA